MDIQMDPARLITERFCSLEDKNMPMEIVYGHEGGQRVRCLSEEECTKRHGACKNCLREYW